MFVSIFNGSGYSLLTATSPGAAAPTRQQLSVMYALTLMCEDAGGDLQSIHAKEGSIMHRQLHDGFRIVVGCDGSSADEDVCHVVLSIVSRAFTALSPCIPWASPGMQRASVPSEHKSIVEWLCRSVRAMLTHPLDQEAAAFYTRFGFVPSPLRAQQLLLLLKDARQLLK